MDPPDRDIDSRRPQSYRASEPFRLSSNVWSGGSQNPGGTVPAFSCTGRLHDSLNPWSLAYEWGKDEDVHPAFLAQAAGARTGEPGEPMEVSIVTLPYSKYPPFRTRPVWKRWLIAEGYILGATVVGFGLLYALPEDVTGWNRSTMWGEAANNLCRAWTNPPVWDKDDWVLNYVGHPLQGSLYYNLLRSQGAGVWESFAFSVIQSCFWEYVFEAVAEQPSIQDIVVTPIAGSLLGELIFWGTQQMRKDGLTLTEKIVVTVINLPFVVNNGYK